MTREELINKWIIPAIKNTWNEKKCNEILKALEQEPCEDVISRQAVLEAIDVKAWEFCDYLIREGRNDEQKPVSHFADNLRECVGDLPSVTPMQNMAVWEWNQYDGNPKIGNFHCSLCHSIGRSYFDYCPYCGAKIEHIQTDSEKEDEE